jgi:flagellar M-ring protein FliF
MEQFRKMLASLSMRQRLTIVAAVAIVGAALYSFAHWKKEADFKPLYTGLAAEDSAAVLQKLKESGAEYRLSPNGDVVSVPSDKLAELRLDLAAAGLPKTGRIGYEIFDKTNLGATEFVEHINYTRALEGELERSLGALAEVEQARVHITFPKDSVFLDSREPAKASVMVKLKPGVHLSERNVTAISHLIGSAVEGLSPEAVSILDMQGNLLSRPAATSTDEASSDAALDYRQKVEHDLLQKINTTLDPLLGHDRYRASVSVDCDLTSGEQSEETFDPAHSVMLQSQKTEEISGSSTASGGIPGTASNLPRPAARAGSAGNSTTRRTENVTYQSSRITRTTKLPQGTLKRVSVALLMDQSVTWEGSGKSMHKVLVPPSPEMLKSVRDVLTAAIGFVEQRGDQITVESLPFEETRNQTPPETPDSASPARPTPSQWDALRKQPLFLPVAIGAGVVLLAILGTIIFVMRRRGKKKRAAVVEVAKSLPERSTAAALNSANAAEQIEAQMAARELEQQKAEQEMLATIKVPPVKTKKAEVIVKQLQENAKKDATSSARILQAWIHDKG